MSFRHRYEILVFTWGNGRIATRNSTRNVKNVVVFVFAHISFVTGNSPMHDTVEKRDIVILIIVFTKKY